MKRLTMLIALIALLFLAASAQAMSSTNYKLEWFVPLTGGGGGLSTSTNYAVDFTIGQTVIGSSASDNYRVALGYWAGIVPPPTYLPLILKN
jgi:hypothetical protein